MNDFSDQSLARRALETRDRGYSFGLFLRRSRKPYLLLVSSFVFALTVFAFVELWIGFYLMLGMLAGCFLRDVGWVRTIGKTWPFSVKVTDWDKVQRIADETDATS